MLSCLFLADSHAALLYTESLCLGGGLSIPPCSIHSVFILERWFLHPSVEHFVLRGTVGILCGELLDRLVREWLAGDGVNGQKPLVNDCPCYGLGHFWWHGHANHVFADLVRLGVVIVRKGAEALPFAVCEAAAFIPVQRRMVI